LRRRAGQIALGGQACALPDHGCGQVAAGQQALGGVGAAVVGAVLCQPERGQGGGALGRRALALGNQGVAADFAVGGEAEMGQLLVEGVPVARAPEQQQPVGAQAVFVKSAAPAAQEGADFVGAGALEARRQRPVLGQRFERVPGHLRQQGRQTGVVAALEGLLHLKQRLLGPAQGGHGRRGCGGGWRVQRRCAGVGRRCRQ